jgi:transcriptional regulator with XRE-family HTH domain
VFSWLLFLTEVKQTHLADILKVSQATISNYTKMDIDSKSINFELLEGLAHFFNEKYDIKLEPLQLLEEYTPEHFYIEGVNT